ncbi:hypothetical protein E2C01_000657 [Portunus trituberculatus]|uniref:Uncharacterized protein n=1 Tax=Portunus trituberculatus TaxID=210409 RepID=A0A5B7CH58_PORTR|nr:hypothetical protein [Portunus trituberculatus]
MGANGRENAARESDSLLRQGYASPLNVDGRGKYLGRSRNENVAMCYIRVPSHVSSGAAISTLFTLEMSS